MASAIRKPRTMSAAINAPNSATPTAPPRPNHRVECAGSHAGSGRLDSGTTRRSSSRWDTQTDA